MNYRIQFQQLFDFLSNKREIEVIKMNIDYSEGEDLAQFSYEDITKSIGYNLENKYKDYFLISLYTHFRFIFYKNEKPAMGGEFHLYPLYDTLISKRDPELWFEGMKIEKINFLKTLRVLDDHPDSGDFKMAAFSKQDGIHPPEIPDIYYYDRGETFKMNIDYGGYLDALIDLAGVSDWQYFFCNLDKNNKNFKETRQRLQMNLGHLKTIFPDKDFTKYYEML